ncbi:hypothetical protein ncot_13890 [Nocardioides sp. JQ2195]|uniref:hypothetical protein n=1 Tax=Nocardioides sp. JQ2195 TaxID=2592334 RepID=UPI00143E2581|nr:hypothetical protein [Nocardioides sp. JQ2195]QIX27572.1 hypothetical protein ncot_13890 [Nocardioides sp. JQ2195]
MNRLEGPFDAVLHLQDRQVVDVDGLLVCKVDDVELTENADHSLAVTGLLVGAPVLLPRFSGHLGRSLLRLWHRLGVEDADRDQPWRIDLRQVRELQSCVRLSVPREGLLVRADEPAEGHTRPMDRLLGMDVRRDGTSLGRVTDVRLEPRRTGRTTKLACTHLVVGRGRPGTMLGYDRQPQMGPVLLGRCIRWMHRHTGQVALSAVDIDWQGGTITCQGELESLTASG